MILCGLVVAVGSAGQGGGMALTRGSQQMWVGNLPKRTHASSALGFWPFLIAVQSWLFSALRGAFGDAGEVHDSAGRL